MYLKCTMEFIKQTIMLQHNKYATHLQKQILVPVFHFLQHIHSKSIVNKQLKVYSSEICLRQHNPKFNKMLCINLPILTINEVKREKEMKKEYERGTCLAYIGFHLYLS
jgi:Na+-translocating ferredoxin:NAD+ oxidoreductase RnfA subunit